MDFAAAADLLREGLNHCAVVIDRDRGLLTALALAGLVGGASHCVGMCGPFVLTQTAARLERAPLARMSEWSRLGGALLLPYHLGRALVYALIGAAAAGVAGHVGALSGLHWLSSALMLLAAGFFLVYGLRGLEKWLPWARLPAFMSSSAAAPAGCGGWTQRVARRIGPLFDAPVGWRGFLLGLALGFLPCGLVYGAVAAAAAAGDPLAGAFGLLAFALGTFPALLAVGLAGHMAGRTWRDMVARVAPALMLVNAGVLGWLALRGVA